VELEIVDDGTLAEFGLELLVVKRDWNVAVIAFEVELVVTIFE